MGKQYNTMSIFLLKLKSEVQSYYDAHICVARTEEHCLELAQDFEPDLNIKKEDVLVLYKIGNSTPTTIVEQFPQWTGEPFIIHSSIDCG